MVYQLHLGDAGAQAPLLAEDVDQQDLLALGHDAVDGLHDEFLALVLTQVGVGLTHPKSPPFAFTAGDEPGRVFGQLIR